MRLTRNFSRDEFTFSEYATRHNLDNTIPSDLITNLTLLARWLQRLRDRLTEHYGKDMPIQIISGYRSPHVNKGVGGSKTSAHMEALAADIRCKHISVADLVPFIAQHMQDSPWDQVIDEYGSWVHVGLSANPRKQVLVARKRADAGTLFKSKTTYSPHPDYWGAV